MGGAQVSSGGASRGHQGGSEGPAEAEAPEGAAEVAAAGWRRARRQSGTKRHGRQLSPKSPHQDLQEWWCAISLAPESPTELPTESGPE